MASTIPPSLKPITPFVLRAKELFRAGSSGNTEIVAYHCYKYAIQLAIKMPNISKDPSAQSFLGELMTELETRKALVADKTESELEEICLQFANSVFQRADDIDQAGNADRATAQSFYAAASFLEILKQFSPDGELDSELKERVLYSKWKATEIVKALKEGRKPIPGGVVGSEQQHHEDEAGDHHSPIPPTSKQQNNYSEDIPVARPPVPASLAASSSKHNNNGPPVAILSKAKKQDALEYARFATAAINAEDYPLAVQRLQECLALLCED